jgi:protein O-GlcNAc transferase
MGADPGNRQARRAARLAAQPPALLEPALWLLQHGQPDAAAEHCAALIERQPRQFEAVQLLGAIKAGQGRTEEAAQCFRRAVALRPRSFEAQKALGIALGQLEQHEAALESLNRALRLNADDVELHYVLGNILSILARHEAALASFDRALALKPDLVEAHNNRGVALRALGRFEAAAASFAAALALRPREAALHFNLGNALASLGRTTEAIERYRQALALDPNHVGAALNLGAGLAALGQHEAALASFRRAQALAPGLAETANNIGNALTQLERYDEAVASFDEALALRPDYADAWRNLGRALVRMKRHEPALAVFARALALEPDHAAAHHDLGIALAALCRYEEAAASFAKSSAHDPGHAASHYERGNALAALRRYDAAIASYERAAALAPDDADAPNGIGIALLASNRPEAAIEWFERALAIAPDHADAHNNRGNALATLKRYGEALASYERALTAKPALANALVMAMAARRHLCDWRGLDATERRLIAQVTEHRLPVAPFPLLAITDDPALHLANARRHWADLAAAPVIAPPSPPPHTKLHLGYLSADFHEHATAYLMAGLFESHDRARFEVFAFSHGIDDKSPMRRRLERAFDGFFELGAESDAAIAQRIREREIDILIDLKGHTAENRLPILARRPAPLQVHYIGYPGTIGGDAIDYLLVDPFIVPPDQQPFFTENLVHLPGCYQINDRHRAAAAALRRATGGLPEAGFVFCCFNNSYKITPAIFAVWMRLLAALPQSVLWLLADNPGATANLRREAEARGIAPDRLVFAGRCGLPEHLARHKLADLFLDTFPYTAHTTASDALWMGLPLVTCTGRSFAARVAGSLLNAAGLPELVVGDLGAYEALALELAQSPARLGEIRAKLARAHDAAPLFDTDRLCRHIESAYLEMWRIRSRGEPPHPFIVEER